MFTFRRKAHVKYHAVSTLEGRGGGYLMGKYFGQRMIVEVFTVTH